MFDVEVSRAKILFRTQIYSGPKNICPHLNLEYGTPSPACFWFIWSVKHFLLQQATEQLDDLMKLLVKNKDQNDAIIKQNVLQWNISETLLIFDSIDKDS